MNHNQYIVSLDIGTSSVYMALGQIEGRHIRVLDLAEGPSAGIKRGAVFNAEEAAQAIREVRQKIPRMDELGLKRVYAGISGLHIRDLVTSGSRIVSSQEPEISRKDVDELLMDMHRIPVEAGEEILHVIPQSYVVDNEPGITNPVGVTGRRLEGNFHIIIGQSAMVRNLERAVAKAGLELAGVQVNVLAASEVILSDDEKEAGVVVAEMGAGTTNLAIFRDFSLISTAIIPFGGQVVSSDIREGCNILPKQAELVKVQFGQAIGDLAEENKLIGIPAIKDKGSKQIPVKTLAFIIQARVEEIIEAIELEIEKVGMKNKLASGIVLTGGAAMLKNVGELFSVKTGLESRLGKPDEYLAPESLSECAHPRFATVLGLLVRGLKNYSPAPIPDPDDAGIENEEEESAPGGLLGSLFTKLMGENPKRKKS